MRRRSAFTLIELLVVIAIIAMLALFMTLAIARMFETTRRAKCAGSLSSISKAFATYAVDNDDVMAASATWQHKVGKYLSIRTTSATGEPTEKEISTSKVMMCASAMGEYGKKAHPDRLYSYARNFEIDVKNDGAPDDAPSMLSIKSPSKTMLVIDGPYQESGKDWKHLATYQPDYAPGAPVFDTHREEGLNAGFVDGRAVWFNAKDLPTDPANTNSSRRTSVYFNATFWMGIAE